MPRSAASLLPADDPRLREDILRLILQYLHDEGFHAARQVLQDEAMVKLREDEELSVDHRRFRKAILGISRWSWYGLCTARVMRIITLRLGYNRRGMGRG